MLWGGRPGVWVVVKPFLRELKTDFRMVTGEQGSIGVLIMARGSAEDRTIPTGPPFTERVISGSSNLVDLSNMTDSGARLPSRRRE